MKEQILDNLHGIIGLPILVVTAFVLIIWYDNLTRGDKYKKTKR